MSDTENTAAANGAEEHDDEMEEISVEITDENTILVYGSDWEIELSPDESRLLAQALIDAAADAESEGDTEETEPAT